MNGNRALIDTSILVYAWNAGDKIKQRKAIEVLEQYKDRACLSIQNISEFSAVMLRNGCDPQWLGGVISLYERLMTVLPFSVHDARQALRAVQQYRMSYWDAQIWSAAKTNGIPIILSDNGPTGQTIEGVTYTNPLQS
jgi:predicted nucleic acid-binding protein